MLDFNDDIPPPIRDLTAERDAIRAELLSRLESVLFTMFPAGKVRRGLLHPLSDSYGRAAS